MKKKETIKVKVKCGKRVGLRKLIKIQTTKKKKVTCEFLMNVWKLSKIEYVSFK